MLSEISSKIDRWAGGRMILALIVVLIVFEAVTLPILQRSPGGNIEPLDARFFYTPQAAFSTIASYEDARSFWIGVYLSWDIINPILYGLILSLLLSWTLQRSFKAESRLRRLNLLPLVAAFFDLLENASIVTLLATFPARLTLIAWLSTLCTMSKVGILGVSALMILFGIIRAAMKGFRLQSPRDSHG